MILLQKYQKTIIFVLLCFLSEFISAQTNFSGKIVTAAIYPNENRNSLLYTQKLTENGRLTYEPAVQIGFEAFANVQTAGKIIVAYGSDAASKKYAHAQIMIRRKIVSHYKHSICVGFGPSIHYRQSWSDLNGYQNDYLYKTNNKNQIAITYLSGEIEYNYYLTKKLDLSVSFNHIHPETIGVAIGVKYWIRRKVIRCSDCPSFRH